MELEKELRRQTFRRRIIWGAVGTALLIVGIVCMIIYENSKVVETVGEGWLSYEKVYYTLGWLITPVILSLCGSAVAFVVLVADIIHCGTDVAHSGADDIVIYKGPLHHALYVNGEKVDTLFIGRTYLEGKLSDGVKVTASFRFFNSYHLTFSDNRATIDT